MPLTDEERKRVENLIGLSEFGPAESEINWLAGMCIRLSQEHSDQIGHSYTLAKEVTRQQIHNTELKRLLLICQFTDRGRDGDSECALCGEMRCWHEDNCTCGHKDTCAIKQALTGKEVSK